MEINTRPGPPDVPHQIREITLRVEAIAIGLRFSTPSARGWAAVARTPAEVPRAIQAAFTEAQVAAYAQLHGQVYDLDALTGSIDGDPMAPPLERRRAPAKPGIGWARGQVRPDAYDPAEWSQLPDGNWRSPGGRVHKAGSQMVQRVVRRRRLLGLPT